MLVIGSGGFAKEVFTWFNKIVPVSGFFSETDAGEICGVPIINHLKWSKSKHFTVAVGSPETRKRLYEMAIASGLMPSEVLAHPKAICGHNARAHPGCIVCPGAVLSCDIVLSTSVIVNLNATIGHDCHIGEFVTISPGANISGKVVIGSGAYIGTNACIREGLTIGAGAIVGMGAVVVKDVPPGVMVLGNPARQKI